MAQGARKIKKRSALFAPVSFLLVCAALVFGLSIFFRVNNITVTGNELYSEEEIIEASGIERGDNLFFINRGTASIRIRSRLPYVEDVLINRALPNRLNICITESEAIAVVPSESGLWAIDRNCKLLTQADRETLAGLIRIEGLTAIAPEVGETVAPGEAETPKVTYLAEILRRISEFGLRGDVTRIDISNIANPGFDYLGRFTVRLGTNEDMDYKFQVLLSAVDALQPGDRGTLDLGIDKRAHLTYD